MAGSILPVDVDSMVAIIFGSLFWRSILLLASVWLSFRLFYQRRMRRLVDKLAGPPGLPIIGNVLDIYVPHSEMLEKFHFLLDKYGRNGVMKMWLAHRAFALCFKVAGSEAILTNTTQISKAVEYDFLLPWLGTGLLTSTGEKWRVRRKLLTPAFHFRILEDFMAVYNEQSEVLMQLLEEKVGKQSFDLTPYIYRCTLDIICESAMGRHMNAQKTTDSPYVTAVKKMTDVVHSRQMLPWLWPDWLFALTQEGKTHHRCLEILHSVTEKMIRERREEFKAKGHQPALEEDDVIGKKTRLAFLDLLLQASDDGRVLSDLDIREEVDTFMFEGHDTTASGLTFALFLFGTHPEIQQKVQDEIDAVLGDTDRRITSDDLKKLKYLECCIKEALRIFPPVPVIGRRLTEDIEVDGQIIPAGVTVLLINWLLHRDPEHNEDATTFNPDRFLPENSQGRHPYSYVPFSAGPRNCIGQKFALMEEKVILAHVLRRYTIEAMEKVKPKDLKLLAEIILRPLNGLPVVIHPRPKKTHQ